MLGGHQKRELTMTIEMADSVLLAATVKICNDLTLANMRVGI